MYGNTVYYSTSQTPLYESSTPLYETPTTSLFPPSHSEPIYQTHGTQAQRQQKMASDARAEWAGRVQSWLTNPRPSTEEDEEPYLFYDSSKSLNDPKPAQAEPQKVHVRTTSTHSRASSLDSIPEE